MPPKPHGVYHSSREKVRKKSKSQKVRLFDFSTFRNFHFFWFFDFSIFSIFSTFRAEISWHVNFSIFRLFDFSTFRGQKSWFARCDRYQPEEHTDCLLPEDFRGVDTLCRGSRKRIAKIRWKRMRPKFDPIVSSICPACAPIFLWRHTVSGSIPQRSRHKSFPKDWAMDGIGIRAKLFTHSFFQQREPAVNRAMLKILKDSLHCVYLVAFLYCTKQRYPKCIQMYHVMFWPDTHLQMILLFARGAVFWSIQIHTIFIFRATVEASLLPGHSTGSIAMSTVAVPGHVVGVASKRPTSGMVWGKMMKMHRKPKDFTSTRW